MPEEFMARAIDMLLVAGLFTGQALFALGLLPALPA
jgi:hypothetical protein